MKRLDPTTRIAFALTMWSATVLLVLRLCGQFEDDGTQLTRARQKSCEVVAIACSQAVSTGQSETIRLILEDWVARDERVLSAACRRSSGEVRVAAGDHESYWHDEQLKKSKSPSDCIYVPILAGNKVWGRIEASFEPVIKPGWIGYLTMPSIKICLLATVANLCGFLVWLRRSFRTLDPTNVVPDRVRKAFDTMAEIVLVLDHQQRIVLANRVFPETTGIASDVAVGQPISNLPWIDQEPEKLQTILRAKKQHQPDGSHSEQTLRLRATDGRVRSFTAKACPIEDALGHQQGTLMSLADITLMEATLDSLQKSRVEIEAKNQELEFLATRDSLTGCLNRRSFFEEFQQIWAAEHRPACGVIMVDIDHFKSINDTHGHAVGDDVLRAVSRSLLEVTGDAGWVGRYGGEEFAVLLPGATRRHTASRAEDLRVRISELKFPQLSATASLGFSHTDFAAAEPDLLLDQADQALYTAKRGGRNRVVRFEHPAATADSSVPLGELPESTLLSSIDELGHSVAFIRKVDESHSPHRT